MREVDMKLHLKRTEETKKEGLLRRQEKTYFWITGRIELSAEEEKLVERMKLGELTIYRFPGYPDPNEIVDMPLANILKNGIRHRKDNLRAAMDLEEEIKSSCAAVKEALERGRGFEEGEEVIEF